MIRINKIFKTFLMVFVLVFFMSGCSTETDDKDTDNDPVDVTDPTDNDDPIVVPGGATSLVIGTVLNEVYDDGEAFLLTIDAAGFYSVKSIGDMDLEGVISTLEGTYVSYDDNSGLNDNFDMIIYLDEGSYLVGVSAEDDDVTSGLYSLLVESTSIAHVSIIGINGMIADSIFPGSTNTVEFDVPSAGQVQLYTESLVDTYGVLYDNNGNVVAENDNGSNDDDFYIDEFLESGTYFIEISVSGDFDYADYELFYDHSGVSVSYDPIFVDSYVSGSLDTYGEPAYFELIVNEDVTVNIYSTGDYDLEGYIFRSKTAGIPFDYNIDGGDEYNFLIDDLYLEAGLYYITVYAEQSSIAYYELHVDTVE